MRPLALTAILLTAACTGRGQPAARADSLGTLEGATRPAADTPQAENHSSGAAPSVPSSGSTLAPGPAPAREIYLDPKAKKIDSTPIPKSVREPRMSKPSAPR
jgi:hypothetical protein